MLSLALPRPGAAPEAQAAPPPATATDPTETEVDLASLPLPAHLDALLDGAEFLAEAQVGVSVVDLESGATLYTRNPELALNPASNVKLVTTAAALAQLGPEHRYATRGWIDDRFQDGVVAGELYLQGGGDPSLVTGQMFELAGKLQSAGVRRIRGPIVVDDSRFAGDGWPPGFQQKQEFAAHRARGGAMSVNYNTFEVRVRPGKAVGDDLRFVVEPPVPSLVVRSEATTAEGKRNRLWVTSERDGSRQVLELHGSLGVEAPPGSYRYPVDDPARYAGELLALSLAQRGIRLSKRKVVVGEVPSSARPLATHRSETLSELCRAVNKWSNNFMAEQILRSLAPGDGATAEQSLEQLRAYTRSIGLPQEGLMLGNGSGLYDNNLISTAVLTQLLAEVYGDFRYRSDFLASLAIMGRDGTARSRLRQSEGRGWVRVKTGTLDDVSALSGYAGARGRDPIAFAIVFNAIERKHRAQARALQDAIVARLASEAATTGDAAPRAEAASAP